MPHNLPTQISEDPFFVFFSISPVSTNTKLRGFRCEGVELLISDGGEIGRVLEGVRIEVHARDAAEASLEALKRIQGLLDSLRLHYYVRSNIYGAARVVLADSEDGTHIALPQPFWTPKAFRRSVPVLPLVFDKAIERFKHQDQDSLLAAKWHLSQAFAVWSEDIHSAGTRIWQAVEVLMSRLEGNLQERLELLSKLYIREIVCDAAESLADRFQDQSLQLKRLYADQGVRPDWHFRNRDRVTALKWLGRILDSRSSNYYEGWTRPAPPEMLFDPAVGLLQILNRKLRIYGAENWMELRTLSDLNLLYALRNRVVHRGERAFSFRLAEHLARVGAELILTVIGCFVEVAKTDDRNNGSPLDLRSVVETRSARGLPTVSSERYSLEGIPA